VDSWINIVRAMGIVLVVFGHVLTDDRAQILIYGFHMPLFFFLSGILFKLRETRDLLLKKVRNMFLPFIFFYAVTLIWFFLVERNFRSVEGVQWWMRIVPLFYGSDINGWMGHNAVLWFIPTLLSVEIIFNEMTRFVENKSALLIISLVIWITGIELYCMNLHFLPYGWNIAFTAVIFYCLGYISKPIFVSSSAGVRLVLGLVCLIGYYVMITLFWNRLDMSSGEWGGIPFVTLLTACLGCYSFVLLLSLISRCDLLEKLGASEITLCIMCIHGLTYRPLKYVLQSHTDSCLVGG
jgi:fucose 4-O-acetylase-like acetyltransferase